MIPQRPLLPTLSLVIGLGLLAACVSDITPPAAVTTLWEGQILPLHTPFAPAGSAAAISGPQGTEIGIMIAETEAGTVWEWYLAIGGCESAGADPFGPRGAYPPLAAASEGTVTLQAAVAATMSANQRYSVVVLQEDGEAIASCGDLMLRDIGG